ncbi:hypothetical protein GCM10010289_79870 [Streptomyces violascens]|nr:hypothetical protein GCM10010289_79870 [Streptomyces violascens]
MKYTGERPVFPTGALEFRGLGAGSTWNAPVALGWKSASPPALASHRGKLHAMYIRPDDRALMWSILENGVWLRPVQIREFTSDHQPALTVHGNNLYMTFTALDGSQKVTRYAWLTGQWNEPVTIPYVHTNDAPAMASDINNRLVAGHRGGDGKVLYKATSNWEVWPNGTASHVSDWTAAEGFPMATPTDRPWVARRTSDNKIHIGYQTSWGAWASVPLPSGWEGRSAPSITTHNNEVWLAVRDNDNRLRCYHGNADGFAQVPLTTEIPTVADMPVLVSHNGTLHTMYRR